MKTQEEMEELAEAIKQNMKKVRALLVKEKAKLDRELKALDRRFAYECVAIIAVGVVAWYLIFMILWGRE